MLCICCQDFDYDKLVSEHGFTHHSTWSDLCASAQQCEICRIVCRKGEVKKTEGLEWENKGVFCKLLPEVGRFSWSIGGVEDRVRLHVCTSEDDPMGSLIPGRPVHTSVISDECLDMMRKWLIECEKHPDCPKQIQSSLPTRVVDVGSENTLPRLVVSNGRPGQWAALSHCWGRASISKTESTNLEDRCKEIQFRDLTPTFQDAILVTRGLGLRYLWIDSLCIVQDSQTDWVAESRTMNHIYAKAAVTIAAEAAEDGSRGIIESMKNARQLLHTLPGAPCHSNVYGLRGHLHIREYLNEDQNYMHRCRGPLSNRAWTLQEEALSSRILRFSEQQVSWRCHSRTSCEWLPTGSYGMADFIPSFQTVRTRARGLDKTDDTEVTIKEDLYQHWYHTIASYYISRQITFPRDKLVAIAGIAREMQEYSHETITYIAGLWLEDIHRGLTWFPMVHEAKPHSEYVAPSWSWAHLDHAIRSPQRWHTLYDMAVLSSVTKPLAEIINVNIQAIDGPFSPVTSGSLLIKGQCQDICSCNIPDAFLDHHKTDDRGYGYSFNRFALDESPDVRILGLDAIRRRKCSFCPSDVTARTELQLQRYNGVY